MNSNKQHKDQIIAPATKSNAQLIFFFHWIFKLKRIESMRSFMILIDSMPVFKLSQPMSK